MPNSEGLHHIIYLSQATAPFTDDELADLVQQCQRNNSELQLTGALVYGKGSFLQVLEGQEKHLQAVFEKIQRDPRHYGMTKLADKPITTRSFSDWTMAFKSMDQARFSQLTGYTSIESFDNTRVPHLSMADTLLLDMMKSYVLGA